MLEQHSLFQRKPKIASRDDLIENQLDLHGDKIIVDIALSNISSFPQVRRYFDDEKIKRLAEDIDAKGLIHPITVMKHVKKENAFILVIGGNRFLAAKYLNWDCIPCIVKPYSDNAAENELLQLAENMHRMDLNPVELSDAIIRIKQHSGYTLSKLAKALGRTVDSLKQYSRISQMQPEEKKFHIEKRSTKNEILEFLAKKKKSQQERYKSESIPLFTSECTNPYKLFPKHELMRKIKEAELFLKQAREALKNY